MTISVPEWLDILDREYLDGFVAAGGSAVKFAVLGSSENRALLIEEARGIAAKRGFHFVTVSSAKTRIHMIDRVFHELARQIAWEDLAVAFLREQFLSHAYGVPDAEHFHIESISELNDKEPYLVRSEVVGWLSRNLFRDYAMSLEFRIAMVHLCKAALDPTDPEWAVSPPILDWLRGDLRAISAVKPAQIFRRVTRHNARHMLQSSAHWLRRNGHRGLVLHLDIANYQLTKGDAGEGLSYTIAAMLDAYEVLRQLVDDVDTLEGCLTLVTAGAAFDGEGPRSVGKYAALKARIWDDVKARDRDNPLAPLVRLAS